MLALRSVAPALAASWDATRVPDPGFREVADFFLGFGGVEVTGWIVPVEQRVLRELIGCKPHDPVARESQQPQALQLRSSFINGPHLHRSCGKSGGSEAVEKLAFARLREVLLH